MMTSIWYRPCLRIAIVIATGIPSSARSADASPMTVVMAASFPAVIKEIVSAIWNATSAPAAKATHLIC